MTPTKTSFQRRRGFTIVEASIATFIIGVLLVASLGAVGALGQLRRIQAERRRAYALAKQLMTEVMAASFADPNQPPTFGPEAGETTRQFYDDVDDYDGYSASPATNKDGTPLLDYTGWTRSVAVSCVDPNNPNTPLAGTTLKRITVTVVSPSGKPVSIVGWRSQFNPGELQTQQITNYVTWVGVDVQVGPGTTPIRTGARPLNEFTSQP